MQQLTAGYPTTINCATRHTAPPQNALFSPRYMSALEGHFLGIWKYTTVQQHSQIAGASGQMADQQAKYNATKIAMEANTTATMEGWHEEDNLPAVLNLMHTCNEVDLIFACPA